MPQGQPDKTVKYGLIRGHLLRVCDKIKQNQANYNELRAYKQLTLSSVKTYRLQ